MKPEEHIQKSGKEMQSQHPSLAPGRLGLLFPPRSFLGECLSRRVRHEERGGCHFFVFPAIH